jgi:hypothetical protein
MENTGKKRVLSFEEFMDQGQDGQTNSPMITQNEPTQNQFNLEKEPEQQDDLDLTLMDEPATEEPQGEEMPDSAEPAEVADDTAGEDEGVEESARNWFVR